MSISAIDLLSGHSLGCTVALEPTDTQLSLIYYSKALQCHYMKLPLQTWTQAVKAAEANNVSFDCEEWSDH